jgi:hypothetical protein
LASAKKANRKRLAMNIQNIDELTDLNGMQLIAANSANLQPLRN